MTYDDLRDRLNSILTRRLDPVYRSPPFAMPNRCWDLLLQTIGASFKTLDG